MYDSMNSGKMSPEYSYFNYQASYLKNSRAIGVLWCVFSMCYAIINVVVFLQPQWLGDTEVSKGTGYFGLWRHCRLLQDGQDLICQGRLDDFSSILSPSFKASTILIGLSVLIITLCICSFVLFFFLHSSTVFHICGWFQAFNGIFLLIGILIFPTGWDSSQIKEVCGNQATLYNPGDCSVRWSFILAIISVIDVFVLSILAFVLGSRYVKMLPDQYLPSNTSIYKGETNNGYLADNLSRKSLTLQPVMLLDAEKYSDYSLKGSSRKINTMIASQHTNGYHPSNYSNNFQL